MNVPIDKLGKEIDHGGYSFSFELLFSLKIGLQIYGLMSSSTKQNKRITTTNY